MKIILVVLLLPLVSLAETIREAEISNLGRGVLSATDFGAECVDGKSVETGVSTQIIYSLYVRPYSLQRGKAEVVSEMIVSDRVLALTEAKVRKHIPDFDKKCGIQYLAEISLGVSSKRVLTIGADEASKITPIEMVSTSDADLVKFVDAVNLQVASLQTISGIGTELAGFKRGANFKDTELSIHDLFVMYLAQWRSGSDFEHVGQIGLLKSY